jgi:hypothetical protein
VPRAPGLAMNAITLIIDLPSVLFMFMAEFRRPVYRCAGSEAG